MARYGEPDVGAGLIGCFGVILVFVLGIAIAAGISAFFGWVFMMLWNFAMPSVWPAAPVITFYPAWALWALITLVGRRFRSVNTTTKKDKD